MRCVQIASRSVGAACAGTCFSSFHHPSGSSSSTVRHASTTLWSAVAEKSRTAGVRRSALATTTAALPFGAATVAASSARRHLTVEVSSTPNPECMRFYSMDLNFLAPGQTVDLPNDGHAYKSPLAEVLFGIIGVKSLYLAHEYITVTRETSTDWGELTPMIQEGILQFAESGKPTLSAETEEELSGADDDTEPKPEDDEVVLAIKELLATRVRPMVMADGGNVRYVGLDEGMVYVMLEGACKTCPSSGATLKNGIERMLMHWIPEVEEVLEVDEDFALDFRRQVAQKLAKEKAEQGEGVPRTDPTASAS